MAPIYDNGNSFYGKHTDSKIASILSDEEKLMASSLNGFTAYENDNGERIRNDAFLGIDNPDLQAAIVSVYKKWVDSEPMIKDFIMSIPSESHGLLIMSDLRKRFYIESMELRFKHLLEPQYQKIVGWFFDRHLSPWSLLFSLMSAFFSTPENLGFRILEK